MCRTRIRFSKSWVNPDLCCFCFDRSAVNRTKRSFACLFVVKAPFLSEAGITRLQGIRHAPEVKGGTTEKI
jgi:hypothetical protein